MRAPSKRLLRSLPILLLAVVAAVLGYGVALDRAGGAVEKAEAPGATVPRDPTGHPLYLVFVDSLARSDVDAIPALVSLSERSFTATIQPCIDNFTTSCVREALTGRSRASVFSMLEDFKVLAPEVGANLVSDAKAAGMRTALVSAGNLRSWTSRVDSDIRVDRGERRAEIELALEAARNHDLVIHHWIWLDIASHHRRTRPERYEKVLAETSEFLAQLEAGLPAGMDLIVTGDHGHDKDGRHIEGLDVPTFVAARTNNLRVVHPDERLPVTGLRFLAGAATGLASPSMRVEPRYREWLADHVGEGLRTVGTDIEERPPSRTAWGLIAAAVVLAVIATTALPLPIGPAALLWAAVLGVTFQRWLELVSQRGNTQDLRPYTWLIPAAMIAVAWVRRRDPLAGAAAGGMALLLALWPGLARYAVLPNALAALVPLFAVLALLTWRQRSSRDRGVLLAVAVAVLFVVSAFDTNTFRIRHYPLRFLDQPAAIAVASVLGGVIYTLVDRAPLRVLGAAALVALGPLLPVPIQALVFVALGAFAIFGRRHARASIALALTASAIALTPRQDAGVLGMVAACGLGLRALGRVDVPVRSSVWSAALVLTIGSYLGLAWTMGLTISGLDFDFALDWLPGRWHMRLWWAVALALILKVMLSLLLLSTLAAHLLDPRVARMALVVASRVAVVRAASTALLVTLWLAPGGVGSATSRMRVMLFDGLCWVAVALAFGVMQARRLRSRSPVDARGPVPLHQPLGSTPGA
jgi:hypothetical protein